LDGSTASPLTLVPQIQALVARLIWLAFTAVKLDRARDVVLAGVSLLRAFAVTRCRLLSRCGLAFLAPMGCCASAAPLYCINVWLAEWGLRSAERLGRAAIGAATRSLAALGGASLPQ